MYHKIIIVGNLGQDPELRYTQSGSAVANFPVATNRKWTGNDGEQQEETIWFRVSVWGKQGEACNQYLEKGRAVLIEGRLRPDPDTGSPRVWTRKDGTPGASFEVTALNVRFLGRGDSGSNGGHAEGAPPPDMAADEIPF